jgi:hypothetical protein
MLSLILDKELFQRNWGVSGDGRFRGAAQVGK